MSSERSAPVNLLLVDDKPENLVALKAILNRPDYRLLTASSGEEALRIALRERLSVILLDVVMPGMDGFEVAQHLKQLERTRTIPILFLTAVATDVRQIYRAYDVGAIDYLVKPLDPEVVQKKVAVLVALDRQREEIERQARLLLEAERRDHELRMAELRLASDRRYRKLVEGIEHVVAWSADEAGRLTFVSRKAPEILGVPIEDFSEPDFWNRHLHPEDRDAVLGLFQRALADGNDLAANHRMIAGDGEVRWFHTGVSRDQSRTGNPELHGVSVEVTALKRSEEAQALLADVSSILVESLDHRRMLPELAARLVPALGDVCLIDEVVGPSATREVASAYSKRALDAKLGAWKRPEPLERGATPDVDRVLASRKAELRADATNTAWLAAALGLERAEPLEQFRPASCLFVPLYARDRALGLMTLVSSAPRKLTTHDLALAEEVGRRAALAMENAILYDEARRAVRAREDVLAVVSHDLRNPLSAIAMSAGVLERAKAHGADDERTERLLQTIRRSVEQIERLISDLLDFGRLEAGQFTIEPAVHGVRGLLQESLEIFAPLATKKGFSLETHASEELSLCCDRGRVLQILSNLLDNAAKFTPRGGAVTVTVERAGDTARFTVSDTGPGMTEEELSRIWERYWQAKKTPGRAGVGLGLYITKGLVEAHGGRIWAESKVGEGTQFHFTLPLADSTPVPERASAPRGLSVESRP